MGIIEYATRELSRELDKKSKEFYEFVLPAIDMYEDINDLVIEIDLPGFAKDEIAIRIVDGSVLSIKARKNKLEEPKGTVYQRQRPIQIDKRIVLPYSTKDGESIVATAKYTDGVVALRIPIPKSRVVPIS
jgi:HSP20 family molecular chaperone IbpA